MAIGTCSHHTTRTPNPPAPAPQRAACGALCPPRTSAPGSGRPLPCWPRIGGLTFSAGRDALSNYAGLRGTSPAFMETRYSRVGGLDDD